MIRPSLLVGFKCKIHREGHKHMDDAEIKLDTEKKLARSDNPVEIMR